MTVVSVLKCSHWVAIASDRMLSEPGGRTRSRCAVKLVHYYNDMVFGYTGLAQLPNRKGVMRDTSLWLAEVLGSTGKRSIPLAVTTIRERADEAFGRIYRTYPNWPRYPHAFVGAGWEPDATDPSKIGPCSVATISNYHQLGPETGEFGRRFEPGAVRDKFLANIEQDTQHRVGVMSVGYNRSLESMEDLFAQVKDLTLSGENRRTEYLHLLARNIRQTSTEAGGKYVGKDILAAIVPPGAALSNRIAVSFPQTTCGLILTNENKKTTWGDSDDTSVFYRFHEGRDDGNYIFPHIVAPGFSNLIAVADPNKGEDITLKFRGRKRPGGFVELTQIKAIRPRNAKRRRRSRQ